MENSPEILTHKKIVVIGKAWFNSPRQPIFREWTFAHPRSHTMSSGCDMSFGYRLATRSPVSGQEIPMPKVQIDGVNVNVTFNGDGTVTINGKTVSDQPENPIIYGYDYAPYIQVRGKTRRRHLLPFNGKDRGCEFLIDQELYEAVMGHNPSHFKDMEFLPLDSASYVDIEIFLRKLNTLLPEGVAPFEIITEQDYMDMLDEEEKKNAPVDPNEVVCYETPGPANNPTRKGTRPCDWSKPNAKGFYDLRGNLINATSTLWSERKGR